MYTLDTLMSMYDDSMPGTMDYVLSEYFLKNALSLHHKRLIDVSQRTHASSSSIIRFCKSGGYQSFSLFCDIVFQEAKQIDHDLRHVQGHFENNKMTDVLVKALKQTNHLILYGDVGYIHLFYKLSQYLFLHGVAVDQCQCWQRKKYDDVFECMDESDVIMIVEPHYSLPIFLEEMGTSGRFNKMDEMIAQKFYLSGSDQSFNDIRGIAIEKSDDDYVSSCIELSHSLIERLRE